MVLNLELNCRRTIVECFYEYPKSCWTFGMAESRIQLRLYWCACFCPAIYFSTTSKPCPTEPWKPPGAHKAFLHHFFRCGYCSLSFLEELDFIASIILLGDMLGEYWTKRWTWSSATAILMISTSRFLQVFRMMRSQVMATPPCRTLARNFGVRTRWTVKSEEVWRSTRTSIFLLVFRDGACIRPCYSSGVYNLGIGGWAKLLPPVITIVFKMSITGDAVNH